MNITICGHRRAAQILAQKPGQIDVIMISSPDSFFGVEGSNTILNNAKSYKLLAFHDISIMREGLIPPEEKHVKEALEFAKDKDELIVCCQAGISRSSAIAYVLKTTEVGEFEALAILDPMVHHPNGMIVKLGSQILNKSDMVEYIHIWNNKAIALQCENPNWDGIK